MLLATTHHHIQTFTPFGSPVSFRWGNSYSIRFHRPSLTSLVYYVTYVILPLFVFGSWGVLPHRSTEQDFSDEFLVLYPGSKLSNGFAPDIRFAMVIPIVRGVRNRLGDFLRRFKATTFQRQRA